MTPEKDYQPIHSAALIRTIALSWVPVVLFLGLSVSKNPEGMAVTAAAIGVVVVIATYLLSRKRAWSSILWVPLVLFAAVGGIALLGLGLSASTSGPSAAPLEGVAVLMLLLMAAGLGAVALGSALLRPQVWSVSTLGLGVLNSALMVVATSYGYRAATQQDIVVHLRDPSGIPVPGVEVKFERLAYGEGGKHVFDARGGPVSSDDAGVVRVPSRRMRYETRMTMSKGGFRDVTLVIGMQFAEYEKTRDFVLSTHETRAIAAGSVPATDPLSVSLYLSPVSDSPSPDVRHFGLYSKSDLPAGVIPKSLHLETGKFTADLSGDLELEYFSASKTRYRDQRLRIRALHGSHVRLVNQDVSLTSPESAYEQLYRIAPESGYDEEVVIEHPGNEPGPVVYIRAANGKLHGMLRINAQGDGVDEVPRYSGRLEINPSGRTLEWIKKSD